MNLFFNPQEQRLRAGWRVLIQFILMFFLAGFATLGINNLWQSSLSVASTLGQFIGVSASILIAAHLLDKRPVKGYGLSFDSRWWIEFFAGAVIAGGAISVIFVFEWQMGWLSITGYGWESMGNTSFGAAILSSLTAMLLVGFYEEWFSRGYQLLNLAEGLRYPWLGTGGAVAIATLATSLLFGALHYYNPNASTVSTFNIVLAGIVLALPYILTGSLGLSVGLHFSWNFMQGSIFGFPVSGTHLDGSLIQIAQKGTPFWTGGAFGPEAGMIGIFGMAIMAGGTYVYIMMAGYECSIAELFEKERSSPAN
ncbi:CPBP family intramembrane glutamic endopeptidase [Fodinibius sediminis]|uniref:CAAX prenyl protease 2/Lysostaphin resistance protein A-like domain-containing protein n=1 Tax=Fodinibius sediminis TaxID=1214077 RepID=A0A521ARP7_9BACT|nr:type II CAAX endopeptidase family protein [Fodinibius sediminis]SMO37441.1 hypothetical protein SAMN06265218_101314 [Fodinibius sediminis]